MSFDESSDKKETSGMGDDELDDGAIDSDEGKSLYSHSMMSPPGKNQYYKIRLALVTIRFLLSFHNMKRFLN